MVRASFRQVFLVALLSIVAFSVPAQSANQASRAPADFGWKALHEVLSTHVDDQGMVNYRGLKAHRATLDDYVRQLETLERSAYDAWPEPQKIAFWINAYNAITLHSIIDHYPIRKGGLLAGLRFPANSIRQIDGVWDDAAHPVMGRKMSLAEIEHEVLRKQFKEPRIHMALVCAAMGCPPLRNEPYRGDRLGDQLEDQSGRFFAQPAKFRVDRPANTVSLSPIFDWFGKDFAERYATDAFTQAPAKLRSVLNFAARHARPTDTQFLKNAKYDVQYLDYDWSLNEQR
jgi:hypothetical protein